jgi:hypothetical protein
MVKAKDVVKHLAGDIKGYKKERAYLKKEIAEDKELQQKLRGPKMKKQGYNARLDESLGMRKGKESGKKQSYKSRRDESKGMEKARGKRAYSGDSHMDMAHHHMKEAMKFMRKKKK